MDPFTTRKNADLEKLYELAARIPATLKILQVLGNPPYQISGRIKISTPYNDNFPSEKQDYTDFDIRIPNRYPLESPTVVIKTPIWNPNIFLSGKWCFGSWQITETLEQFVIRLMKVIALDPVIINLESPANNKAKEWYQRVYRSVPKIFPTVSITSLVDKTEKPIIWHNR